MSTAHSRRQCGAIPRTGSGFITAGRHTSRRTLNFGGAKPRMSQFKHRVPYRRLLVRGVNWLGDAVMTTPALQRLRQALPGCHITLLTHEKLADLWIQHPSLDAILQFKADESLMSVAGRIRG